MTTQLDLDALETSFPQRLNFEAVIDEKEHYFEAYHYLSEIEQAVYQTMMKWKDKNGLMFRSAVESAPHTYLRLSVITNNPKIKRIVYEALNQIDADRLHASEVKFSFGVERHLEYDLDPKDILEPKGHIDKLTAKL